MEMSPKRPFSRRYSAGLIKFVSWGTLVLILLSSLFLSIFLANYARQVLLEKQYEFARLWAETLNHNISRRFALPAILQFGELNLANPEQFKVLDTVVQSVLEDFPVQDLRIYTSDGVTVYALDKSLVGQSGLGGEAVAQAVGEGKLHYEFLYQTSLLGAMFSPEIVPRSVVMRTMAPLRFKGSLPVAFVEGNTSAPKQGETGEPAAESGTPGVQATPGTPAEQGGQAGQPGQGANAAPGQGQQGNAAPGQAQAGQGEVNLVKVDEVIGALEFTQDITEDYQKLITFQRIIILSNLVSACILFFVLRMLIHRADRLSAQRLQEREVFEREMLQNEKLASMGRMVAGIAHEIRNPLGIIRSSSELLVSRQKDKDPLTAKILTAINEEAVRLSKTVGDFLDYARPRNLNLEPVDLALILDQALTFLEQKCRDQGVEVVRAYARGIMVRADKDLLYRAVYNILVNALEAMAGQVQDAQARDGEEGGVRGQIIVQVTQDKDGPKLTIMDTGPGMPEEIRDKLLDPFFTTKQTGTGLGLAITANILRSHGAALTLGENPEGGARVDIAFAKP
ncbi:sensor histidine kinase [Fundidesulfovibrio terrae]|uniref:sensor histidine kinase n=1 Tax=Fundidesulfovibrio terrae TaxID=2922866 RepID=UPI001FAF4225|nr:ATP-binding protein [Fundidesulfovibrio terrae]